MERRSFLRLLGLASVATAYLPELESNDVIDIIVKEEGLYDTISAYELNYIIAALPTLFERESAFFRLIERAPIQVVSEIDMRVPLEFKE